MAKRPQYNSYSRLITRQQPFEPLSTPVMNHPFELQGTSADATFVAVHWQGQSYWTFAVTRPTLLLNFSYAFDSPHNSASWTCY